jgi:hypothetical protein
MTDKNQDTDDQDLDDDKDNDTGDDDTDQKGKGSLSKDHEALLEKLVADKLKVMKANVDKAYKEREALARENARLKADQEEGKRKKLEDEGKHVEAAKLRIAEVEELNKVLTERLTAATRDKEVDRAIGALNFRNDYAKEVAVKSIIEDLVQDDDGVWVHKSGASLADYVKTFAKDPTKDFLFKPKENNGAGTTGAKGGANSGKPKTVIGMSTEELLAAAKAGQLGASFSPI